MYVMLHQMGKTYGKLPSELLAHANTLDLVVFDAVMTYERHLEDRGKNGAAQPTEEQMAEAIRQMRGQ